MKIGRIKRGVLLGFVSMGVDALVGLVSYPLLLRFMPAAEVGIWVLYASLGVLLGLAQLGIVPSLTRLVATARGAGLSWCDHRRAGSTARIMIGILIGVVALVAFPFALAQPAQGTATGALLVGLGWGLYVIGAIGRMSAQIDFAFVNAAGEVGFDKVAMTGAGLMNLALMVVLVGLTGSLVAAAASFAFSGILLAGVAHRFQARLYPARAGARAPWSRQLDELRPLLRDSWGLLILNITTFVISQSCLYLVERWEGLETLAGFGPIVRVQMLLTQLALLPVNMTYPFVSRCWAEGDFPGARRFAIRALGLAVAAYLLAALPLLLAPEWLVVRWLGSEHFVGAATVRSMLAYGLLFVFHSSVASPCLAVGGARFIGPALVNMLLIGPAIWFSHQKWGLTGVPIGMTLATFGPSLWVSATAWRRFWGQKAKGIAR